MENTLEEPLELYKMLTSSTQMIQDWTIFYGFRVEIPLNKSLAQSWFIYVNGENIWIPIQFEKLMRVCFTCEIINHTSSCRPHEGESNNHQYSPYFERSLKDEDTPTPLPLVEETNLTNYQ